MTLLDVGKGTTVKILTIADEINRPKLIRLGIWEESTVRAEKIPMGGPVLVNDSICIGRNLAKRISVELAR